jgi:RHS repeat-associated protein
MLTISEKTWAGEACPASRPVSWPAETAPENPQASYYRARYYDPVVGRFTREDPLGFYGGDVNLYRYVWNSSSNFIDPVGEWGFGATLGASLEGGIGVVGAGTTGSAGGGLFFNGLSPSVGAFASGGAFAGGPGWGPSAPSLPDNSNWAGGAFGGGGLNLFLTNANDVADLAGPFKTYSFNLGWGVRVLSLQFSIGKNCAGRTIGFFSYGGPLPGIPVPTGGGYGASLSKYNTNTLSTGGGGDCGCH